MDALIEKIESLNIEEEDMDEILSLCNKFNIISLNDGTVNATVNATSASHNQSQSLSQSIEILEENNTANSNTIDTINNIINISESREEIVENLIITIHEKINKAVYKMMTKSRCFENDIGNINPHYIF
jgi:hypothetical protein